MLFTCVVVFADTRELALPLLSEFFIRDPDPSAKCILTKELFANDFNPLFPPSHPVVVTL